MKKHSKFPSLLLAVLLLTAFVCSCGGTDPEKNPAGSDPAEFVDYASILEFNRGSFTAKEEVTVKNFVDGDTVHFNISESVMPSGILKARFIAVNTPESTGKIEPYGKAASNYTKQKLKDAVSIIVESDTASWNPDSTGDRYLVWVWYKTPDMQSYRNLNLELLQNGLAIASNSQNNIYGSFCVSAIDQARAHKLTVYSGKKDPDFYDGAAVELTLRELRTNIEAYRDVLVAFDCVITSNFSDTVYVEEYDSETDMYYGISVYYGNSGIGGDGLKILSIGNKARIVGKVQYYETGETWQISGIKYRMMKPDDPENIKLIEEGHTASYVPVSAMDFANGTRDVLVANAESGEETICSFSFAELAISTTVSMSDLFVESVSTTQNDYSSSNGAMTLHCSADGIKISVRTTVFRDENGAVITKDAYIGKTIDVRGVVDYFDGEYQIKVFTSSQINVH